MTIRASELQLLFEELSNEVGQDGRFRNFEDWQEHFDLYKSSYDARFVLAIERSLKAMTTHTYPIVGAYYHPPAKALLDHLPVGAPLFLRPDPHGSRCAADHSDPTALSVWLKPIDAMPIDSNLELKLHGYGFSTAELMNVDELHIGYIPKDVAATLAVPPTSPDIPAEFSVGARGTPRVRFTL